MKASTQYRLLNYAIVISLFFFRLLGFWPYRFDHVDYQFKSPVYLKVYTAAFPFVLSGAMVDANNHIFGNGTIRYNSDTGNAVQMMFGISCIVMIVLSYLLSCWHRAEVVSNILPEAHRIVEHIKRLHEHDDGDDVFNFTDMLLKFAVKALLVPSLYIFCEYLKLDSYAPATRRYYIRRYWLILPSWVFFLLNNIFSFAIMFVTYGYRLLNAELCKVVQEQKCMHQNYGGDDGGGEEALKMYGRMNRFCALSDRVDAVAVLHMQLGNIARRLNRMFSIILFTWCWHRQTYILLQMFFNYQALSKWAYNNFNLKLSDSSMQVGLNVVIIGTVEALLMMVDFYMLANICTVAEEDVHKYRPFFQ